MLIPARNIYRYNEDLDDWKDEIFGAIIGHSLELKLILSEQSSRHNPIHENTETCVIDIKATRPDAIVTRKHEQKGYYIIRSKKIMHDSHW